MRRCKKIKSVKRLSGIQIKTRAYWPFIFWEECAQCNIEFRREWGWKVESGDFLDSFWSGKPDNVYYVCGSCAMEPADATNTVGIKEGYSASAGGVWRINRHGKIVGHRATLLTLRNDKADSFEK